MAFDLSKYSDDDYKKVKSGNIQALSDQGYLIYKQQAEQYKNALQASQNPKTAPDAVDKAAQGSSNNAQPLSLRAQAAERADAAAKRILPNGLYSFLKPLAMQAEGGGQGLAHGVTGGLSDDFSGLPGKAAIDNPGTYAAGNAGGKGLQAYLGAKALGSMAGPAVSKALELAGGSKVGKLLGLLKSAALGAESGEASVATSEGSKLQVPERLSSAEAPEAAISNTSPFYKRPSGWDFPTR